MVLFKEVKKPLIKAATSNGGDVSSARPAYTSKTPPCSTHCPNLCDIRGWLTAIAQHEAYNRSPAQAFEIAWRTITEKSPFPAIEARLCQHPCEQSCNRKGKDGAVSIHLLERFIGDYGLEHGFHYTKLENGAASGAIAVVGAGPAGLSCAYHLARHGYAVTVFDAAAQPGGMMRYRVPRNILPDQVLDAEIGNLLALDVQLLCNTMVGRDVNLEELRRDYAAVYFAMGLQKKAQLELKREGNGAVVVGAVPDQGPPQTARVAELDQRVANSICPAIAQGRGVAEAIHAFLTGNAGEKEPALPAVKVEEMKLNWYPPAPPHADIPPGDPAGLSETEAVAEAKRCMSCGMCMDCETCWMYCTNNCFVKLPKGEHYKIKLELCNGCKKCAEACPCGYITMN